MRICTNCWHITTGKPVYCNRCSSSYNVKLCSRQHVNPRAARACSECGSTELSRPQPKAPIFIRPVLFMLFDVGPGILLLLALSVYVGFYIVKLVRDPNGLLPLMLIGLALGLLFLIWMKLHSFYRRLTGGKRKEARR